MKEMTVAARDCAPLKDWHSATDAFDFQYFFDLLAQPTLLIVIIGLKKLVVECAQ
jgi:hypothetical protein